MSKKFSTDSIKNLKVKIKESNMKLFEYYKQSEFKPDQTFSLYTEQSSVSEINKDIVLMMVNAIKKVNKRSWDEFEAGKILFESLDISPKQASDIGFWTYHNHYTFYQYISKRWGDLWDKEAEVANPSTYIIDHWIQSSSNSNDLIRYPISGLWWSFYLTVDYERKDKYELTKVIFENLTLRTRQLGNSRFGKHRAAMIGILEFIKENQMPLEQASRKLIPFINRLGGNRPLSYFNKDWFKGKLEKRFGEKAKEEKKLLVSQQKTNKTEDSQTVDKNTLNNIQAIKDKHYFCLNVETGNYIISSKFEDSWDYCIGLNFELDNQYLIHFYKEGKIKKTKVIGGLSEKIVDRSKPYSNGKCLKLKLSYIQIITKPVLFGIAYKTRKGIYFKAMDEQCIENFRVDNCDLNQEGKKILYLNESFKSAYKVLPYGIKEELGSLVQQSPSAKGAVITNKYYEVKWKLLKQYWPELFNGSIKWS